MQKTVLGSDKDCVEKALALLDEAVTCMANVERCTEFQASEIQIRLNQIGMRTRSVIEPRTIKV